MSTEVVPRSQSLGGARNSVRRKKSVGMAIVSIPAGIVALVVSPGLRLCGGAH